jgi:hypothetical protein
MEAIMSYYRAYVTLGEKIATAIGCLFLGLVLFAAIVAAISLTAPHTL